MIRLHINKTGKAFSVTDSKFIFKIVFCLTVFSSFFYSCSKENAETPKAVTELIQNLKSQNTACTCEPFLDQYSWRNKTVYVLAYKGPACNWFPGFYDSKGQEFKMDSGYTNEEFFQESIFEKNIWTCK